jgi:outer membrane autotransporter protein
VIGDPASWRTEEFNADWGKAAIGAEYAYALGYSGAGVKVGVLDSGVDADRWREREFADRLHLVDTRGAMNVPEDAGKYEFGAFDGTTSVGNADVSWHGTHVAGTIASARNGDGMHGVAWGAGIYSASHYLANDIGYRMSRKYRQLLGENVPLQLPAVAQAYTGLLEQDVRIINNSWGGSFDNPDGTRDELIKELELMYGDGGDSSSLAAFRSAASKGVVSVFAAGNDGKDKHANPTSSLPMAFADLESNWLAVAALEDGGGIWESSQNCGAAKYWCVAAPGVGIVSTGGKASMGIERARDFLTQMDGYFPEEIDMFSPTGLTDWIAAQRGLPEEDQHALFLNINPGTSVDPLWAARSLMVLYVQTGYLGGGDEIRRLLEGDDLITESDIVGVFSQLLVGMLAAYLPETIQNQYGDDIEAVKGRFKSVSMFSKAYSDEIYRLLGSYSRVDARNMNASGTSMAAPHVSGALAIVMERYKYLSGGQARDVLLTTSRDLGDPGVDALYGWGIVDLKSAMDGPRALLRDWRVDLQGSNDVWTNDLVNGVTFTARDSDHGRLILSGPGHLDLRGNNSVDGFQVSDGTLTLSAENQVYAATLVDGGVLNINATGRLTGADLRVDSGSSIVNGLVIGNVLIGGSGRLSGSGKLQGDTTVAGTIAPGNSIGTLTIDGNYVQTSTGVYAAELAPGERSDLLRVTGAASLDGTLAALPEPGVYYLGEQFTILQADGGVSGQFARTDFSAFSPFLQFNVAYAANGARLDVGRGALLASAASTPNQRAVAGTADTLAINQGLPRPLTQLFPEQAGAALDGLSGELHAATPMALVENSRYVRDAALTRTLAGHAPNAEDDSRTSAWVQAIGGNGRLDGDGNAARTDSNATGMLAGLDFGAGHWQLGALIGAGRTDVKQQDNRRAKSKINNTHVGLYAGHRWGGFGLRGGLAFSRHKVDSTREVAFAGFSDTLKARYDASTRQAFIEAGYRFGGREAGVEPYLQVARVEVDLDDVRESGSAAALHGRVEDTSTTVATAGLRFDKGLKASFQKDSWLHVRGGVGYRRASGDRNQVANLAFNAGDAFTVSGAPIADKAVVAELGLSAWLTARQQLEFGYSGQFGDDSRDHSLNARWSVQF